MEFRQHLEKEKQRDLAQAKNKLQQEEKKLELLNHTKDECQKETRQKKKKDKINLKELSLYQIYLTKLHHQIKGQRIIVVRTEEEVEGRREELLEKSREKKVLENLRKGRLFSYKEEANRIEQKEIDELARDICLRKKKR
ncbi:MAG TPA: flagellar export protein FliJ [candidate division Zixibacteria bacterium]